MKGNPPRWVVFIDDGGVMNENHLRGPQWQRLLGEFLPPRLGGTPEEWAHANSVVAPRLWGGYGAQRWGRADADYAAWRREERLEWLHGMCELVGVTAPPDEESLALARAASRYVTRRVRAAFPGAVDALRLLFHRGHILHTASGEQSEELDGYLEGMGVRECFHRLYGPDLVNTHKEGPEYYARIFADAAVPPRDAVVVDDSPVAVAWAASAGARTILVGTAASSAPLPDLRVASLAEVPAALTTYAD